MARNGSGVWQQPAGTAATPNTTIESSKYNQLITDIGNEITASLPRDGRAAMTGALKLIDGAVGSPAVQFTSASTTGWYYDPDGAIVIVIGGVEVARFTASGLSTGIPIAAGMDYHDTVAPPGWIFPYGQNLSRTTYAALFAKWNTRYGAGDGSTTFGCLDKRGRPSFTKDDMGGTAANRIQVATTITTTNASATATVGNAAGLAIGMTVTSANIPAGVTIAAISGTTLTLSTGTGVTAGSAVAARFSALGDAQALGSAGGAQTKTQSIVEMPSHNHTGGTGNASPTLPTYLYDNSTSGFQGGVSGTVGIRPSSSIQTSGDLTHAHTIPAQGGGLPISILPPGIICNYIIFAGA